MNLLFAYPIILPTSSCGGDVPMEIIWATLIVVNTIWLISFIVAEIHNSIINERGIYRNRLTDREYFFVISIFGAVVDIIAVFCGLVLWVATLL